MTNTVQDVINTTQRVFPGMVNSVAKEHFDSTHREIVSSVHLLSDYETINTISNGVAAYDINGNIMGVYECRLQKSSNTTDFTPMMEVSRETVAQDDYEYLKRTSNSPDMFSIDGSQLVVYGTPNFNSTNGYPRFILRVDRAAGLNTGDALPNHVPSHDAWKFGVLKRYAEEIGDPKIEIYERAWGKALNRLQSYNYTRNRYIQGPTIKSKAFFNNPRVR